MNYVSNRSGANNLIFGTGYGCVAHFYRSNKNSGRTILAHFLSQKKTQSTQSQGSMIKRGQIGKEGAGAQNQEGGVVMITEPPRKKMKKGTHVDIFIGQAGWAYA